MVVEDLGDDIGQAKVFQCFNLRGNHPENSAQAGVVHHCAAAKSAKTRYFISKIKLFVIYQLFLLRLGEYFQYNSAGVVWR